MHAVYVRAANVRFQCPAVLEGSMVPGSQVTVSRAHTKKYRKRLNENGTASTAGSVRILVAIDRRSLRLLPVVQTRKERRGYRQMVNIHSQDQREPSFTSPLLHTSTFLRESHTRACIPTRTHTHIPYTHTQERGTHIRAHGAPGILSRGAPTAATPGSEP